MEAAVRVERGAEAREHAHRPELRAVHRRVRAARVRDTDRGARRRRGRTTASTGTPDIVEKSASRATDGFERFPPLVAPRHGLRLQAEQARSRRGRGRPCSRRRRRSPARSRTRRRADTRNAATAAISSGRPSRRSLCSSRMCSRTSSSPGMPNTPSSIGVSMKPGQIALARMPDAAVVDREVLREDHDRALRRVVRAAARGALETLDARDRHDAAALAVDERLFEHARDRVLAHEERAGEIHVEHALPLVAVERGARARRPRRPPRSRPRRCGRARRPSRRPPPAIAASSRTSACDERRPRARRRGSVERRAAARSRSRPTTRAPSRTKRATHASPIPDAAPVTSATLPSRRPMRDRPSTVDVRPHRCDIRRRPLD